MTAMQPHTLRTDSAPAPRPRRSGFTLIESLIATVVLAIAVVGIAGAIGASYKQTTALDTDAASISIARALLEEACAKPFAASTSASKASAGNFDRSTYTDIADYHGYHDQSPFTTLGGETVDVGEGYTRTVTYTVPASVTVGASTVTLSDFGRITVSVHSSTGRDITLSRLVSNVTYTR
jgi:prepilin-type N-terminal cleavage/methylation domain-containing protein